jgi:hypothetical protein
MSVVFSTYHSLDVISRAQHLYGLPDFDLVICDEAHRTTGATFETMTKATSSKSTMPTSSRRQAPLHDRHPAHLWRQCQGQSRVWTTSPSARWMTRRCTAKSSTSSPSPRPSSVAAHRLQGPRPHGRRSPRQPPHAGAAEGRRQPAQGGRRRPIVGCWKALAKQGLAETSATMIEPMKRAVAFCQVIERNYKGTKPQGQLQADRRHVPAVVEAYQESGNIDDNHADLRSRARGRHHERQPEGGQTQLAQGRAARKTPAASSATCAACPKAWTSRRWMPCSSSPRATPRWMSCSPSAA